MFAPDGSPHKIDEPIRHDRMLAVVEVGEDRAVTWTKPDDLPFDPDQPLAALGTIPEEGFYAVGMGLVPTHIQRNVSGDAFRRLVEGDPPPEPQDPESLRQQATHRQIQEARSQRRALAWARRPNHDLARPGRRKDYGRRLEGPCEIQESFRTESQGNQSHRCRTERRRCDPNFDKFDALVLPEHDRCRNERNRRAQAPHEFVYRVRESGRRGLEGVSKNHDIEIARYRKNRGDRCRTRTTCSAHEARIS